MQDLELFLYESNPMLSVWLVYVLWRRMRVLWNSKSMPQEEGKPDKGFCSVSVLGFKFPTCQTLSALFRDQQTLISSRTFPEGLSALEEGERGVPHPQPFSRCISTLIQWGNISFLSASSVMLQQAVGQILTECFTTHFSISSNPVLHFSDSEKKPFKQKLPEYIECRTVLPYSLQ